MVGIVVMFYCTICTDICPAKCTSRGRDRNRRDILLYNMYLQLSRPMFQESSWSESL